MSDRNDAGKFAERVSDNEILKVFDNSDAPFLTATEVADAVGMSRQGATYRLKQMREDGLVESKEGGSRAVGWWATVAPRLSEETRRNVEASEGELERGETTSQDEMKARLGIDG